MGHIVHLLPGRKNGAEISIGRRSRLYAQRLIILTVHHNIGGHDRSGGGNGDSNKDNLQSGTGGGEQIFREMAEQACEAIVLRFEIHADPEFFFCAREPPWSLTRCKAVTAWSLRRSEEQ